MSMRLREPAKGLAVSISLSSQSKSQNFQVPHLAALSATSHSAFPLARPRNHLCRLVWPFVDANEIRFVKNPHCASKSGIV